MVDGRDSGSGIRNAKRQIALVGVMAAVPCVALAVVSAWWFAAGLAGAGLWPPDRVTLGEAVATRNNAEALRLVSLGANPNQPSRIREGLLTDGYDIVMTPVEAAVGAQRADSLRMLLANGAIVDGRELLVLRCYERMRHDSGVREILDALALGTVDGRVPDGGLSAQPGAPGEPDCAGVHLPSERSGE